MACHPYLAKGSGFALRETCTHLRLRANANLAKSWSVRALLVAARFAWPRMLTSLPVAGDGIMAVECPAPLDAP